MSERLDALAAQIPPSSEAAAGEDWDRRSRAVLSYLVELAPSFAPADFEAIPADPATCPNCGEPVPVSRSPYCGDCCKEEAALVRQFRNAVATGAIADEERQAALGQKLWHLLGGGYPRRVALIPPKGIARVIARDGKCMHCGAPATTVDNIGSG
ncbi:MAG TPA: hypothetical protein VHE55_17700 [Fimbriimonadaceae bacterium]|nr:hypothetical protein [Fimbriimonadaceae bacterium]